MVGVFVAFIRVVYERMIYMSLPLRSYTIGIKLSIYISNKNERYNCKKRMCFSLYANCSLIAYQPNRANLI